MNSRNRRKVLVPLATMAVAGAVVVGSGATFTSETVSTVSVTSGVLSHANDQAAKELKVANIKPGDTQTGTLTITNDGSLDATLAFTEKDDASTFAAGALQLTIKDGDEVVYTGDFGGLDKKVELGALPVDASKTITYTVSMPQSAGDENQGKTATAKYAFVTTQTGDNGSVGWF